jgi:regulator of sigma E protease
MVPQSLGNAISYGLNRTVQIFQLIASIPGQLMSGNVSPEEARPVSIVGISQIGGQFLRQSIRDGSPIMVLEFLGLISIFLGITNLLPLPPLDGGRIVFVLIEILRGKPVSPRIEYAIHRIGITLLLSLGVIIIIYDIFNPLA